MPTAEQASAQCLLGLFVRSRRRLRLPVLTTRKRFSIIEIGRRNGS